MAGSSLPARALEMARTGQYSTIEQIRRGLRLEGFTNADLSQLLGRAMRRQLFDIMRSASPVPLNGDALT
jgi:hypothetical protein